VSGVALDRLLYDFEFLCATKEAYFKKGLIDRFKLIDRYTDVGEVKKDIVITFNRNKPSDKQLDSTLYNAYYKKGISTQTLRETCATFIDDPEAEKERADEESQGEVAAYGIEETGGLADEADSGTGDADDSLDEEDEG
jgi:hypothetical protein